MSDFPVSKMFIFFVISKNTQNEGVSVFPFSNFIFNFRHFYSLSSKAKLKNVDRSSATYHSVTVNDITVVITEFKPKKPKEKKEKKEGATLTKKEKEAAKQQANNNSESGGGGGSGGGGPSTAASPTASANGKAESASPAASGSANGTHGGGGLAYVKSGATPLSPTTIKVKKEEPGGKMVRPSIKKEDPTSPRPGSAGVKVEGSSPEVKSEVGSTSNGSKS